MVNNISTILAKIPNNEYGEKGSNHFWYQKQILGVEAR